MQRRSFSLFPPPPPFPTRKLTRTGTGYTFAYSFVTNTPTDKHTHTHTLTVGKHSLTQTHTIAKGTLTPVLRDWTAEAPAPRPHAQLRARIDGSRGWTDGYSEEEMRGDVENMCSSSPRDQSLITDLFRFSSASERVSDRSDDVGA